MHLIKTALILVTLVGCEAAPEPTMFDNRPMRAAIEGKEIVLNTDRDLQQVADLWKRGGRGAVELTSTYKDGTIGLANYNASTAASRLKQMGVTDVNVTTLPAGSNQVIAYVRALKVGSATGCQPMITSGGSVASYDQFDGYKLGCGTDDLLGRQVANTDDLEGRLPGQGYNWSSDSARAAATLDDYRAAKPSQPLNGLAASDIVQREK